MRLFALIGLAALVTAFAISCGGGGESEDDSTATPEATSVVGEPTQTGSATATATASSGPSGTAPEPDNPPGTISVAVFDIGPGVGLGSAQAPNESMQYWGVGEGLFAVDADGNIVNKLATGYEVAPDFSSVTITVRDDVRFQSKDGQDFGMFSADDVVFTLNDANANTNPTSIHGQAGDFAALFGEATKVDATTVTIPFISYDLRWNGNFLNEQAQGTAFFSKVAYDTMGRDWMLENIVSTGPFQVVEWIQDDRAVLQKVDYDHWYKNPEIENLRFIEVPDPANRVAQLESGQVDIADLVPLKDIRSLTDGGFKAESITKGGTVHSIIFSGNYWEANHARTGEPLNREAAGYCSNNLPWVGCNIEGKRPGDMEEAKEVRWALANAIDRQLLVDEILDGFGTVASTEYVDTTASYYQSRWDIPYDPDAALAHMASTSWPEGKFDIGIWTGGELGGSSGTNAELNDAISSMWLTLWPDMNVQVFKSAYSIIRPSLVGRTNTIPYAGDCDEGATTIPFDWPHGLTETSFTRGGYGCGIEIPKIAETFTTVSNEPDLQERIRINTELIDYLHDEMLIMGTVQVPKLTVYNPNSIAEWEGTPSIFATMNEFENIVLADR